MMKKVRCQFEFMKLGVQLEIINYWGRKSQGILIPGIPIKRQSLMSVGSLGVKGVL